MFGGCYVFYFYFYLWLLIYYDFIHDYMSICILKEDQKIVYIYIYTFYACIYIYFFRICNVMSD